MKNILLALPLLALAACTTPTPIADVSIPPATLINGSVTKAEKDSIVVQDASGSIEVEIETDAAFKPFTVGEKVAVYGNLDEDEGREFDAYRVERADGSVIDVIKTK